MFTKGFFILVGIVGTFFLINAYVPAAWSTGFHIGTTHIAWAVCIIVGVLVVGLTKLSSK
jgi:hypothetical protein